MALLDNLRGVHTAAENRARWDDGFRAEHYAQLPRTVERFMRVRAASLDRTDYRQANAYVRDCAAELTAAKVSRAYDEDAIRDYAENYSRHALQLGSLEKRAAFAVRCGLSLKFARRTTAEGRNRRLVDPVWWRRQLRKSWTRKSENGLREVGMVRRMVAPYASDIAVEHHGRRLKRQRDWINECDAVNADTGEYLPLAQAVDASVANPALRRGELMVRARGFEELAAFHGHAALFVTLTCPSTYHAELMYGGRNPAHRRQTVREAQSWLCDKWAKVRAKLKRLAILYYGVRVAEPHHDATPHWHLLLFVPAHQLGTVRDVLRGYWLSDAPEPGAAAHRVRFEEIDSARGSAAGYLAKYVSKNIDGAGAIGGAEDGETGGAVAGNCQRVTAWASVHGIRQFQQLGGPAITVYRELRRLREAASDPDIERARSAADRGDFGGFVGAVGGIRAGRRTSIRIERAGSRRAPFQPAVAPEANYYGEPCRPRVIGVSCASAIAITRPHRWRIQRKCTSVSNGAGRSTAWSGSSASGGVGSNAAGNGASGSGVTSAGCGSPSGFFSELGPVAITVRDESQTQGWTNPQETSTAGPKNV